MEKRTAALLALLILNGPTPRAKAAALVWPEVDDQHANNSLRQRIFKLRQMAGRDVIVTDKLIALADDLSHDMHSPLSRLADNPEACQGELLGSLDYADCGELNEWIGVARERWRSELARALAELSSRVEGEGRIAVGLRLAERLVELDPTQEHAHRRIMRLHYLRGDRAAAMAAFDRCRMVLRAELGVTPDRETQDLQRLIESDEVPVARAAAPRPVSLLRPPRMVGRDAEWQRMQQAAQQRQAVLITGEAGIGKSRLLADFAAAHATTVVRARPGDASVPYASMARLLRALFEHIKKAATTPADAEQWRELARILPELGPAPPGPLEPVRLRLAIEYSMAQAALLELRAIGLDDVQFADAASLELLPALVAQGRSAEAGLHWLLASRAGELPASLRAWADAQDAQALTVLPLGPLDEASVEHLLESLALPDFDAARWAPALRRHTGGNPMFILETLRSLLDGGARAATPDAPHLPLPSDVRSLIERRLQQLSPEALNLARVAALAGQDFSPELAAHAMETRVIELAEPWRELEQAQVIRDNAFAHDLILEATRRTVPVAVAQALHRSIARHMEATTAPTARIAIQWRSAMEHARAAEQFMLAAAATHQAGNKQLECELYLDAAACYDLAGLRSGSFRALRSGLDAIAAVRSMDEAKAIADKLSALARDDLERADAMFAHQFLAFVRGNQEQARDIGQTTISMARAAGAKRVEFEALRMQAGSLTRLGISSAAADCFEAAQQLASELATPLDQAQLLAEHANCIEWAGRRRQAIELRVKAIARFEEIGNWSDRQVCLNSQAVALAYLGRLAESVQAAQQAYAMIEHIADGKVLHIGFSQSTLGTLASQAAEYKIATDAFDRALECFSANGLDILRNSTENLFSSSLITLGQYARAKRLLAGDGTAGGPRVMVRREGLLARLSRVMGIDGDVHVQRALQLLKSADHLAGIHFITELEASHRLPAQEAMAACKKLEERAARDEYLGFALHARVRQVECLCELNARSAAELADAVVDEARSCWPNDMYLPELWWAAIRAYELVGRSADALAVLRTAQDWIGNFALPRVPESFQHSFLQSNPVNRAILAMASRALSGPP